MRFFTPCLTNKMDVIHKLIQSIFEIEMHVLLLIDNIIYYSSVSTVIFYHQKEKT